MTLLVIAPLLLRGPSCGHDFDFHLLSWLEAAGQLRHGTLYPSWATTPAWNAGEPRFVFYPPLSWMIGAVLSLLVRAIASLLHVSQSAAFTLVPVAFTYLAELAGGIALFHVARRWVSRSAALVAATLYMCSPYALFTAYERTAFGELLSMALFPLLIAEALPGRSLRGNAAAQSEGVERDAPSIARLAVLIALLWLSNAPAAVMGCYTFLFLAVLRLGWLIARAEPVTNCLRLGGRWILATALGFALAGVFLIPALTERPWVQLGMAVISGMRPADNTLFHRTGDSGHDAVLHTASIVALYLAAALLLAFLYLLARDAKRVRPTARPQQRARPSDHNDLTTATTLFLCGGGLVFMLTPPALPLWRHVPDLAFLQFPWRLLAVLAAVVALLCAFALRSWQLRAVPLALITLFGALTLISPAWRSFHQACDAEDTPQARFAQFAAPDSSARGSEPTDEYTPAAADNDALNDASPPFWLLAPDASDEAPSPDQTRAGGAAPRTLHLQTQSPARLVFNLRDYPAWSVTRNGSPVFARIARNDGLLAIPLPPGDSDLRVRWTTTRASRIGDAISLAALLALCLVWRHERRHLRLRQSAAGPRVSSDPDDPQHSGADSARRRARRSGTGTAPSRSG